MNKPTYTQRSSEKLIIEARHELSSFERGYSKFMHAPVIEHILQFLALYLLRPNAFLYGALALVIGYGVCYTAALYLGYPLSGLEGIVCFSIGWLIGVLQDFLTVMITGKKRP